MSSMIKGARGRVAIGIVIGLVLLIGWYSVAANYDYGALAGTYVLAAGGNQCTLRLAPDHTFTEEIGDSSNRRVVQGQWHRYGQAHVSFSSQFIKISGEELNAAGEAHGQFEKAWGLWPRLILAPIPDGPTFRRHLSL
jgi:hypothetical protein